MTTILSELQPVILAAPGIVGTILGNERGAANARRLKADELAHEDQTRFHARRLKTYVEFTKRMGGVIGMALGSNRVDWGEAQAAISSWDAFRLVATPPVFRAGTKVHAAMVAVLNSSTNPKPAVPTSYDADMVALITAIRAELGVDAT